MPTPEDNNAGQEFLGLEDEVTTDTIDNSGSGAELESEVPGQPAEIAKPDPNYDPKTDPKRIEYWQSQADKHKQRADKYEPLARLIDERQDVREAISNTINKVETPAHIPQKPAIEKPEAPVRPSDYDSVAAVQDPESPSYKYRASMEKYQEDRMSYYDKREEMRQAEFERRQQEQIRKEAAAIADATLRARLSAKGIVGDEQEKFIQTMSSPQSFEIDNLIRLYEVVQGKQPPKAQIDEKQRQLEERIRRGKAPLPPGVDGSQQEEPAGKVTDEDNFNNSLFGAAKASTTRRVAVVKR